MKEDWKSFPGPKALAYPHDASYSKDDKEFIAEQMEKAIAEFLSTQRPMVTAPKAARSTEAKRTPNRCPWCYLVSSLSEENIDLICAEGFVSNTHATLHVLRFDPPPLSLRGENLQSHLRREPKTDCRIPHQGNHPRKTRHQGLHPRLHHIPPQPYPTRSPQPRRHPYLDS